MPKPEKIGRDKAAERNDGKSKGKGRENAPGQNTLRTFAHKESGATVVGTMNQFHATLKDMGYRPVEETPVEETSVEETPVEETPVEEVPVEETSVEETPVEETPVEDETQQGV